MSENVAANIEAEIEDQITNGSIETNTGSKPNDKEKELLDMVFALESEKQTLIDETKGKLGQLRKELEESHAENERLRKRNTQVEQNLKQFAVNGESSKSKIEQNDILTKAKTLLFEKTKICKQQEHHIEMLKNQVESLKEVLTITKDMLNLRNTEVEHLQARLDTIDLRIKGEKDKQALYEKKLEISQKIYADLRKEYDSQSKICKELKMNYEEKNRILIRELAKAKMTAEAIEPPAKSST